MDFSGPEIVDPPLVYSLILNHNAIPSAVMHCLTHSDIKNINITSTSKCMEVSNRQNRFINFFVGSNAVCTPTNSTIFNICNRLNNFILEFFGQLKFF